jgi:ABC-2 type transport system permease protein
MLRNSPFFQLYRARLREFWRQPARIFWVYGFPTVLAVILGLAFQNRPPAPISVDLVTGPFSESIERAIQAHNVRVASTNSLSTSSGAGTLPAVVLHTDSDRDAEVRLKTGKSTLSIVPVSDTSWSYRYDPTRPEAVAAR